jgi:hypothetical protein
MNAIRPCRDDERELIFGIINAAAEAYRGVIPDDCWHDPYMSLEELEREIAAGSRFGATRPMECWSASWASSRCATLI